MSGWVTYRREKIDSIKDWVRENCANGQICHIGTDSMQTGKYTQFVTVVVILKPPKGGRIAYFREVMPRVVSLRERLLKETWKSVTLGLDLTSVVPGELTIHIDANPVLRHKSSQYVDELVGMVVGQGFQAVIKPDAWAASHCADHLVRTQGKMPRSA